MDSRCSSAVAVTSDVDMVIVWGVGMKRLACLSEGSRIGWIDRRGCEKGVKQESEEAARNRGQWTFINKMAKLLSSGLAYFPTTRPLQLQQTTE